MVSRQAQVAASKKTANTQPSSDDKQPEPTLVYSPGSSPTAVEVPVTVSEGDEVPTTITADKAVKRQNKIPKFRKI